MNRISFTFLAFSSFLLSTPALAQDAPAGDEPSTPSDETPTYQDKVSAALVVVANGLTADAAAQQAVASAPSVATREAEIELAKASQNDTLARFVPQLTFSAAVGRTSQQDFDFGGGGLSVGALNAGQLAVGACADGSGDNCVVDSMGQPAVAVAVEPFQAPRTTYSLQAQLNVPLSDYLLSLPSVRKASAADLKAADHRLKNERETVAQNARVAYYEWLRARAQLAVATESLVSVRARLGDARINLEAGTIAPADVLQIESLEASSQVAIVNSESYEELARQNLATLMGVEKTDFAVGEAVLTPDIDPPADNLKELIELGVKNRHDVRGLLASRSSAKLAAKGARSGLYPRLDASATVLHANPNPQFFPPSREWNTSWSVGLSLSWGLDRFFAARAQVKSLNANEAIFDSQLEMAKRGVKLEITAAWQEQRRASASVRLSDVDLQAAEAAYSQRVMLYKAGEATTSEVIDAEVQRFNASLRSINARIDLRIANAKLRRAAGLDVTGSAK